MRQLAPSKADTALLPPFVGLGLAAVVTPLTHDEFASAARDIMQAGVVGFDTESKPTFVAGEESTGPHVLQFALTDRCFVFQLCNPACREFAVAILQSPQVKKVGFGLGSDRTQIRKRLQVEVNALVDLDTVFRKLGYPRTAGVRAAVAIVLNQKFHKSKRVSTSNWSLKTLSDAQKLYAANDAYAALKVWEALQSQAEQDEQGARVATETTTDAAIVSSESAGRST